MIDPESRSLAWIEHAGTLIPNIVDTALIEKAIRALSLLESLVRSGCPFIFKGGTALMLHLDTSRRLSIDIDIVCPPVLDIREFLRQNVNEYGFIEVEEVERHSRTGVPKSGRPIDKILLDVLYEDIHYHEIVNLPISSPLLKQNGAPVMVKCPSLNDMLGDKLTAFAPHTTGIPFFKGEDECFMEIMKQLYDISSIIDCIDDISAVCKTYNEIVPIELGYRKMDDLSKDDVLNDTYNCAMNICMRGALSQIEYRYYSEGARRVNNFIIPENYNTDIAIRDAAKVAYLIRLIQSGRSQVKHYEPEMNKELSEKLIQHISLNKLNRIKKINIEAFFYLLEIEKMEESH